MQTIFVFDRVAVLVRHWYEVSPEDCEHGARIELREVDRPPHAGSESAAQPFTMGKPIWRADLFDLIGMPPGNMDRAHHHTRFAGYEPTGREWAAGLTADPFAWLGTQLRDVSQLLTRAGFDPESAQAAALEVASAATRVVQLARACSGASCRTEQSCLEATRDTRESVGMMLAQFRGGSPDPRVARLSEEAS